MNEDILNNFSNKFCKVDLPLKRVINDYDDFAPAYEEIMGEDFANIILPKYTEIAKKFFGGKNIRYLDLACGSGSFDRKFLKVWKGTVEAFSMDSSSKQIKIANKKSVESKIKINYSVGDIIKTNFPKNIDIVVMNFDVINHIRSLNDWKKLFSKIYKNLNSGGILLFDFNTQKRITNDWNQAEIIVKPNMTYVEIGSGVLAK